MENKNNIFMGNEEKKEKDDSEEDDIPTFSAMQMKNKKILTLMSAQIFNLIII